VTEISYKCTQIIGYQNCKIYYILKKIIIYILIFYIEVKKKMVSHTPLYSARTLN